MKRDEEIRRVKFLTNFSREREGKSWMFRSLLCKKKVNIQKLFELQSHKTCYWKKKNAI